uniref:lytic transglycosylase n=1 Tax=Ningiella ruwaisensis TaxID=2364274 RepID=UPI001F4F18C2|nr:LysM peptidoglycan-binding domain-containing protein [Ningiella ruwaisensis]
MKFSYKKFNHLCAMIFLSVLLGACSVTSNTDKNAKLNSLENKALIICSDIHENAEDENKLDDEACVAAQDGVSPVIHPKTKPTTVSLPKAKKGENLVYDNLWHYIGDHLSLKVPADQARINKHKKWFLKHPNYMEVVSARAEPFLFYIVQELKAHDMPLDIALLPIVESSFDALAYSPGKAAGIWQFIPSTGKNHGMAQNWWYDGRRDVIASTQGAIEYLKRLHKMFDGNWMHALAAYNSGEGRVQRAIRKNKRNGKPTDFWSLDLPRETRAYVPKLLALAEILRNKDNYNFVWPEIDNIEVIQIVDIGGQLDLSVAADLAGLSVDELKTLNPGFKHFATAPDGPHYLVLPSNKVGDFSLALSQLPDTKRLNWARHEIKSGDSIGEIALAYNTSVNVIKRVNNMRSNTIYAGDHLLVPISVSQLDDLSIDQQQLASIQLDAINRDAINNVEQNTRIYHTISSGDTLWDISRAYNVSIEDITSWNKIKRSETLKLGSKLALYTSLISDEPDAAKSVVNYKVKSGDSLSVIAQRFSVRVRDIMRWNGISKNDYLQIGQELRLFLLQRS